MPKYYLADVPHDLRTRVLDRCFRRLYHEALELLYESGIQHYNRDDLINFYNWAPTTLPNQPAEPEPSAEIPRDYPQPAAELIEDINKRLAGVPADILQRIHHALMHEPVQEAGSLLWKAAVCLSSADLYEYRKTFFPPNSLIDPYTQGAPLLRPELTALPEPLPAPNNSDQASRTQESASAAEESPSATEEPAASSQRPAAPISDLGPLASEAEPPTTGNGPRTTDNPKTETSNSEPPSADPEPAAPVVPPPIFKRRGKISGLPKTIREQVNVMLDEGATYERIIEWLDQNGFPAINKVNLHNWHKGGFRDWLREQERIENQSAQREWLGDIITQSQPGDLHHCILTLFASQILDSLFGMDTTKLKAGLAASPRDYIALMNGFRRLDKQLTDAPEFQKFLEHQRARKQGRGLSAEVAYQILRELRLDRLVERARQCEEFQPKVKPG